MPRLRTIDASPRRLTPRACLRWSRIAARTCAPRPGLVRSSAEKPFGGADALAHLADRDLHLERDPVDDRGEDGRRARRHAVNGAIDRRRDEPLAERVGEPRRRELLEDLAVVLGGEVDEQKVAPCAGRSTRGERRVCSAAPCAAPRRRASRGRSDRER